ncbi:LLM class flavin-dependent oxidoreductase [Alkalicoccus chagannorensis]|uniref:LLM class flavin-dependent oxidoreductase n=1 Tax=Alkalicoccus chagannorensis TaxID=427072 RepID=UPI00040556CD|nr:LLM class flavin-dependent oxidoreductase [Alkalicoccus chagannorensis]
MSTVNIPVSALNLVPLREGKTKQEALHDMVDLAQHLESLQYNRYWISEHHNTSTLMSSATPLLIQHVLDHTKEIAVGSGGVMLPNHTPLAVAEQFGTMATLHPGRVELGLGRAPGTDQQTAAALRRGAGNQAVHAFPEDIEELQRFFGPEEVQGRVQAHPGMDTNVPLYILGSSPDSAVLAARLGLPYAFAAHFAPTYMEQAIDIYRSRFEPSDVLDQPHMMVCANLIGAETDAEAEKEMTSLHQFFLNVIRGTQNPLQPPVDSMEGLWTPPEAAAAQQMTSVSFVGSKDTIAKQLEEFQERFAVDEIMAVSYMYDTEKQKQAYTMLKEITSGVPAE